MKDQKVSRFVWERTDHFGVRAVVNENGLSHKALWRFPMGLLNSEDFVKHCEDAWKEFTHHFKDDDDDDSELNDAWAAWKQKVKEIAINEWKKEKRKRNSLRKKLVELRLGFNPNNEEARRMNDVAKEELEELGELEAKDRATEEEW